MRFPIALSIGLVTLFAGTGTQHVPTDHDTADIDHFHLTQKTCALFVAPHTAALGPVGFGRDIDDSMVRWNTCPGGTMVACRKTTTADGDTQITGLPKPGAHRQAW